MIIQCPHCKIKSLSVTSWHDAEAGTIVFDLNCGRCSYNKHEVVDK